MVASTTTRGTMRPAEGKEEEAFLPALRRGDERALLALVARHDAAMLRFARRHAPDAATAEDAVQDAWIGVLRGLPSFEPRATLRSWIFRILLNRLRSRLRQDSRSASLSRMGGHIAGATATAPPDQHLLERELHTVLGRALAGLPPAQRAVIALRDVEGWRADAVCRRLNVTAGHQRVLLHRARAKVRGAVAAYLGQE